MKHLTQMLFSNLFIFAIGNLITKGIQFFLLPLYTSQLTPQAYGAAEVLAGTAELISPIVIFGIHEAMFRFAVQKENPENIFTTGLGIGIFGNIVWFIGIFLLWAALQKESLIFILFLALFTGHRMMVCQFLRGMGWTKRYTLAGICQAVSLVVFQFILLPRFGGQGYLWGLLLSQMAGALAAVWMGRLWAYWKPHIIGKNKELSRQMLQYALPIIPAALFLQIMNISGRYLVLWFCGEEKAGFYTAAAKIGAAVRLAVGIFQQAWQYVVSLGWGRDKGNRFFAVIFRVYTGGLFLGGGVLLFCLPLAERILLKGVFQQAGRYLPLAAAAAVFQGCMAYFSAFYLAEQKTDGLFRSAAACLVVFLAAGFLLAPMYQIWGVFIASVVANVSGVIFRASGSRRWVPLGKSLWGGALLGVLFIGQAAAACCPIGRPEQISLFAASILFAGIWLWRGWKKDSSGSEPV